MTDQNVQTLEQVDSLSSSRHSHQSGTHNDDTQSLASVCSSTSCGDETDSNALDLAKTTMICQYNLLQVYLQLCLLRLVARLKKVV